MAKFKVGDRVKVHYIPYYSAYPKKYMDNQEFIIERIARPRYKYDKSIYRLENDGEFCWSDIELELVKPKFDINDYPGYYVMHVTTKEEDKIFRTYLDKVGKEWSSGSSYTEWHSFDNYGDAMCYNFNYGCYADMEYYNYTGAYTILEFKDFDWSDFEMNTNKQFTKKDLKNGDVVKFKDGEIGIVCVDTGAIIAKDGYWNLSYITENLEHTCGTNPIVAVRRPREAVDCMFDAFDMSRGTLVYERKEVEEMTLEEVCKALGKEIKIVKK